MHTVAELVLGSERDSVPRARRLVREALADAGADVADDAELVVSELVTNATLHGQPPIVVRVLLNDSVRVEVADAGRSAPILLQGRSDAMTGRGLSLVAALSSRWGAEARPEGGKTVWAELAPDAGAGRGGAAPEVDFDSLLAAWPDDDLWPETVTVHLGPVSTELLLSAKAHIDNVVRELTLMGRSGDGAGEGPAATAELVRSVTVDFAEARAEIKRQAAAAAARGATVTDLELHLPPEAADAGERYLAALDQADRFARSARLLTLAPPAVHRIFREWYVRTLVEQLRARSAGSTPAPVRPLQLVLAEEVTRLSDRADESRRLELLQTVTRRLAAATTAEEMARCVVEHAVEYLGVESARVRLLTPDGLLRPVAFRRRRTDSPAPQVGDLSVESDLPGAVAVRDGQRVFIRSLGQTFDRYPEYTGLFSEHHSGHFVPLAVSGETLGLLSLTFESGALTDLAEEEFVEALADVLAQALKRAQLATSDREQRQALSFVTDATRIMISANEPTDVLNELVSLAVPRLGDWCTVYLAEGDELRRVAMAVDGHPEVGERFLSTSVPVHADNPLAESFRTGQVFYLDGSAARILERLYPGLDFEQLGGDPDPSSGLYVPMVLRGRRVGVLGLTFLGSGRRVTPLVAETLQELSARAAVALDNARRRLAQAEMVQALVGAVLPTQPPLIPGLEFAARYIPAKGEVAGDWWEAEAMPDGSVLIGIGDAAGHGIGAVSRMSELRHGARALAAVNRSPGEMLESLNRRLGGPDAGIATALYGLLDPATGVLRWASAGHLPPVVVRAGGEVEMLEGSGAALGVPGPRDTGDRRSRLDPGETMVLYTDGLVERHGASIEDGIHGLLATVAGGAAQPLGRLADLIIRDHAVGRPDDCCVLLVRRSGG
jgi:GAF domain-containing protein/anti-sigma regulatory factor (Ser/Thr protein kinase)